MKPRLAALSTAALLAAAPAIAQWREGQLPVAMPEATPAAAPAPDAAMPFARAYAAAGRPRVVLMWNRDLSDQSATQTMSRTETRNANRSNGASGGGQSSNASDNTWVHTSGTVKTGDPARSTRLAERDAAMLERAFVAAMGRAGMRFVDRNVVMRTTAASQHRGGGDQQLIETDALVKHGEMILEVLLVEDSDAPLGYAFDVRAKDLKGGYNIVSVYSRAVPQQAAAAAGRWQAGTDGYEYKQTAAVTGVNDIADALAKDVMREMSAALRR